MAEQEVADDMETEGELLRLLVENVKDYAIVAMDPQGRIQSWNPGAERLLGYAEGEILGEFCGLFFTPEDVQAGIPQEEMRKALETGRGEDDRWHVRKDGSRFWCSGTMTPLWDDNRNLRGFAKIMRDRTDLRQAVDELARRTHDSEQRRRLYEAALSNTPDLVYVFDLDHRFAYANEGLLALWGRTWDEAIGKNCLELGYPPWHAALHDREIEQVVATKEPVKGEVPFNGTFGRRIYEYILVPVLGVSGEVEAVAGTTRDVTEHKRSEATLREADIRKNEFLAVLAHELRNPLAPITNALELMRITGEKSAEAVEMRDIMRRQVQQLVRLVDDLLDVSRITTGKIVLRNEPFDLAEAVTIALEASRPLIDEARHHLTVTLPPRALHVEGDKARLAQVLSNLLANAAKYTPEGGTIWLTVSRDDRMALVQIRDTGMGIPAEMLPLIFEMFTQVDRNLGRSQGGLGIGLALVRSLVQMHGGTVEAHSDGPGRGSEFVVRIPLLSGEQKQPPLANEQNGNSPTSQSTRRRILVVDDNKDSAETLAKLLGTMGNETLIAHDGPSALEAAVAFRPQVVLLDIGLPGMSGHEVARRIRQMPAVKDTILVAQTGWGQDGDKRESEEAGFDAHLVKPVDAAELRRLLAGLPKNGD